MWGHLQVSFCWYLVFIQYSCFPQDRVQARVQHVVSVFLQLFVVRFQIWPSQKDRSLIWSPYFIFPLQLLPAMLNHIQDHLWESMFHIIQVSFITSFYITCCSYRSNSRTVCEEAKPTYHGYGTPKCHQEPKQDCKQVFFLKITSKLDQLS